MYDNDSLAISFNPILVHIVGFICNRKQQYSPGVEDRGFSAGVGAYEQDDVSRLNAGDCSVCEVVAAHVRIQIRKPRLHLEVAAAQPICQVLHGRPPCQWLGIQDINSLLEIIGCNVA